MVNFLTLNGSIRNDLGSANTRRLRKEDKIPAVIYGNNGNENIYFSVLKKDFEKEYLKTNIQLKPIELDLDGKKYKVLVYQIDLDPVTDMPRHVDFVNLEGKKELKVCIPVNYTGSDKAPGIKKGGFLNILKRKIECFCTLENIPSSIEVDVSKMHIGSKVKINDITLPNNVKATEKSNFDICSITGRGKSTDEATPAAAAATAATPAAGATTPATTTAEPAKK
ncbi:MAG TPA: 50S ribosomal protein L25/general stress protein Ctc [Rickettsiales bacterium]|nr:50S ribosomal protein L25/general stress protein Ctc [Rickettsiales bacterium]